MRIALPTNYTDTVAERAALTAALHERAGREDLQLVAIDSETGAGIVATGPVTPQGVQRKKLSQRLTTPQVPRVVEAMRRSGLDTLAVDLGASVATGGVLTPAHRAVRDRVAAVLGVAPWEVDVAPSWAGGHLAAVELRRVPRLDMDAEKRREKWATVATSLPDGHDQWTVEETLDGSVTLTWQPPEALPALVRLEDLAAELTDADTAWDRIAVGRDSHTRPAGVDLGLGPHALYVGPTGSGKTVALLSHISAALLAGHQVAVVEAVKGAVDFACVRPWAAAWGTTIVEAESVVLAAYAEGERRKRLLSERRVEKWQKLPREDHVHPLTVVLDEYSSLVLEVPVDKGLPERVREQLERENMARALIRTYVGKIARELRFVGIHLVIAMQRADVSSLGGGSSAGGGELRSNLSSGVQLVKPGSPPSREALRMIFPDPEQSAGAFETIRRLDDGASRGLAVTAGEGGAVRGVRVAYAEPDLIEAVLDAAGVPVPNPLPLERPEALREDDTEDPESSSHPAPKKGKGKSAQADVNDLLQQL
ncbi:FtsK/SpoIIIE domain-containing protein [Kocuria carniphila]|uniref:FtsK/SpoIIIE domain-containing protein n=1 Tax=Kocuria carniphila TaxID=262208 RepID=UPI0034DADA04